MKRTALVAGNWKMYTTSAEGVLLTQKIAYGLSDLGSDVSSLVEVAVCPPFTGLRAVSVAIEIDRMPIVLGAQDVHWETEGAFTGAIAPRMLTHLNCRYVIVGHSERRTCFGETDEIVNKKVRAAYAAGLLPIMCVGEALSVHDAGQAESFVRDQVTRGAAGLTEKQAAELVVAYEPIWAIGTGHTPSPEAANDVARSIRATIGAMYGQSAAMSMRVLYGGSVKPENARLFFVEPDIDGGLIGGASLKAELFLEIVKAAL